MKAPKIYTIKVLTIKTRGEDRLTEKSGTLEELIEYFGYTLEVGHSYDHRINRHPKTIRGLVSAAQKSSDIMYGSTFTREIIGLAD